MTSRLRDLPGAVDTLLDVGGDSLRRYLVRLGWEQIATGPERAFVVFSDPAEAAHQVKVPLDESYIDYAEALQVALERIADALAVGAVDLLDRLRVETNDILYVSALVDNSDSLGADQALRVLNGMWRTITAAAWAEDVGQRVRTVYRGPRSPRLVRFLSGLRLAHTRPGSFRFPVLSPLPEPEPTDDDMLDLVIESFERRALRKAVQAIGSAVTAAIDYRDTGRFRFSELLHDGVSANLCRALAQLPAEVPVRFEAVWSPIVPEATDASEVPTGFTEVFDEAADRLGPEDAAGRVTVVGHVRELRKERDAETGEVTIRSLIKDSPGLFRVVLAGENYVTAGDAHLRGRAVFVEGDLERTGSGLRRLENASFRVLGFELGDLLDEGDVPLAQEEPEN